MATSSLVGDRKVSSAGPQTGSSKTFVGKRQRCTEVTFYLQSYPCAPHPHTFTQTQGRSPSQIKPKKNEDSFLSLRPL